MRGETFPANSIHFRSHRHAEPKQFLLNSAPIACHSASLMHCHYIQISLVHNHFCRYLFSFLFCLFFLVCLCVCVCAAAHAKRAAAARRAGGDASSLKIRVIAGPTRRLCSLLGTKPSCRSAAALARHHGAGENMQHVEN